MTGKQWTGYVRRWWPSAAVRAGKTFFQTLAGTLAGTALFTGVDWPVALSASGMAALLSLVTSLAGLPEVDEPEVEQ